MPPSESMKRRIQPNDTLPGVEDQQIPLMHGRKAENIHSPLLKPHPQVSHTAVDVCQPMVSCAERIKLLESASQIQLPLWHPRTRRSKEVLEAFEAMIDRLRSEITRLVPDGTDVDDSDSDSDPNPMEDDVSLADSLCAGYLEKQGMRRARRPSNISCGQFVQSDVDGLMHAEWDIMRNILPSRTI